MTEGQKPTHSVLVVEDDDDLRGLLHEVLTKRYSITPAATLKEASKVLAQERFDALVLDIQLTDGNGLDLYGLPYTEDLPEKTIVISANNSQQLQQDIDKFSIPYFHEKPIESEKIMESLEKICRLG